MEVRYYLTGLLMLFMRMLEAEYVENLCYKCVSNHIIENWGYYLPILAEMDTSSATKRCTNDTTNLETVSCRSPCFILNVTRIFDGKVYTLGVLRGCQSTFWSKNSKLDDTKRNCTIRRKEIRKREFYAEYCFCNGDHCNGKQPNGGYSLKRLSFFRGKSNSWIAEPYLFVILLLAIFCSIN